MEHAFQVLGCATDDFKGIGVRFPLMDDKWFAGLTGDVELPQKHFLLHRTRRQVIVVVEADFADRHHLGVSCPTNQLLIILFLHILCVMRMHADGRINLRILLRQGDRTG